MTSFFGGHGGCDPLRDEEEMQDDTFSLDLLISRVEELQRINKLEAIQKLTQDNSLLQQVAVEYQKQRYCTIDLLEKAREAVLELQQIIGYFCAENEAAERAWLAAWSIERSEADLRTCNFAGWV